MESKVFIVRKGAEVSLQRENRRAKQIKAEGYLKAITEDNKRFYINNNKGILM